MNIKEVVGDLYLAAVALRAENEELKAALAGKDASSEVPASQNDVPGEDA